MTGAGDRAARVTNRFCRPDAGIGANRGGLPINYRGVAALGFTPRACSRCRLHVATPVSTAPAGWSGVSRRLSRLEARVGCGSSPLQLGAATVAAQQPRATLVPGRCRRRRHVCSHNDYGEPGGDRSGAAGLGWRRCRGHTVARGPWVWAGTETGANRSSRGDSWSCFHRTPMHVPFVTCAVSMLKYLRVLLAGCFCEMTHAAPRDADWCHSSGRLGRLDA